MSTAEKSPRLELNNGVAMPALGLGVYQSAPEDTATAVATALGDGYRLVDTAAAYGNETQVGEGIRSAGIPREELFITAKLWIADYGYEPALRGFDASLRELGLDYVDLYLLHWPAPSGFERTIDAYRAAEALLADGRARAIGVSNFTPALLEALMAATDVVPAVNQVELHPWFNQAPTRAFDTAHGIVTQSWSPIGGIFINHPADPGNIRVPIQDAAVAAIAAGHGKSPAQVVLRWHLQHGLAVIPKSVRPDRIAENIDVFDFQLTGEEMASIDALDTGVRGGADPDVFDLDFLARHAAG